MAGRRKVEEAPTKNVHLSLDDYAVLVDWIEVKTNFKAIYGTDKKPTVGGRPKQKKLSAFEDMAAYLHVSSTNTRLKRLSGDKMQNRWRTYMKRFRETLALKQSGTGMGLTQHEMTSGLTIDKKLEHKCPQFQRMMVIFGEIPTIKPAGTIELGVPASISKRQDDGDSDDSDDSDSNNPNGITVNDNTGEESDVSTDYGEDILHMESGLEPHEDVDHGDERDALGNEYSNVESCGNTLFGTHSNTMEGVAITANSVTESTTKSGSADSPIDPSSPGLTDILEDLILPSSVFNAAHIEDQIQTREDHSAQKSLIQRVFDISSSSESDQERNEKAVAASKIKPSNGTKQAHLQTGPKGCVPGKSTASATVATKKKKRSEEKSKSGGSRGGKKTKASAHQKKMSLAEAHLSVSLKKQELQQGFLYDQLAFNKQKWAEEKATKPSNFASIARGVSKKQSRGRLVSATNFSLFWLSKASRQLRSGNCSRSTMPARNVKGKYVVLKCNLRTAPRIHPEYQKSKMMRAYPFTNPIIF